MNSEFEWRNQMRKLGGAVEPARDLWPHIQARLQPAARRDAGWPRLAAAAMFLIVCGALGWHARLDTAPLDASGRTALDWAQPANPALAAAAQDLDGANAQVLQLAVDGSPAGLDPHLVTAFNSTQIVLGPVYEGLTGIDKDLRVVPGLAQSWQVSPDGKTYTFKLVDGASFHDGSKVEATDVVASLNRVLSKEIASPLASRLAALDKATAQDNSTVVLTLKEPSAPLLASLPRARAAPGARAPRGSGIRRRRQTAGCRSETAESRRGSA